MIADLEADKTLKAIVTQHFNCSYVTIIQLFLFLCHNSKTNVTHYFVMSMSNKREKRQTTLNQLSDVEFKDL